MRAWMLVLVIALATWASPSFAVDIDAEAAYARLKTLVGSWKLATPRTDADRAFRIRYALISRDSALVEIFGDPARQPTQTIFHRDGERLLATHYCAQGNQPRLRWLPAKRTDALEFRFLDATNLESLDTPHLDRLTVTFVDADHLRLREIYRGAEGEDTTDYDLVREP